jgi:tRNA threonylcarbamoyl adenosine modification protein YeaZ
MKILGIDSSAGLSVALHDGISTVVSITRNDHGVQGELAADFISDALAQAGWEVNELTDVVVGVGPGPYTGLRVGIVTASVFAHALKLPIHAFCSLDAVGHAQKKDCIVITDARRKELYWARYESGRRVTEPQVAKPAELMAAHSGENFVGPAANLYPDVISGEHSELHAADLADLFARGLAQEVELAPMYLRKPDADEPAPRKQVLS